MQNIVMNRPNKPNYDVVVDIKSKQFMLSKGQVFDCDRLEDEEGKIVNFPVIASADNYIASGHASFKIIKHYLGKKRVVFYKTQRNADEHFGGGGGCRPGLTRLELVDYKVIGGN